MTAFLYQRSLMTSGLRSRISALLRLLADGRERGHGSDHFLRQPQLDERRHARGERAIESRRELFGGLDPLAVGSEGARESDEVGVGQIGSVDPPWIVPLLMHADGAVAAVVHHQYDDGELVLHGGGQLLPGHEEVAVAGE